MRRLFLLAPACAHLLANCNLLFAFAPDQVCETFIRAQCRFAFNCCDATERLVFAGGAGQFRNEGECIQELLEEGGGNCLNSFVVHEAVNQKRFEYDTALAESCIKPAIDALNNCEAGAIDPNALEIPEGCEDVDGLAFGTGKVADEGRCFATFECATPESACVVFDEEDRELDDETQVLVTAVGACFPPAKEGEDCSESETDEAGTDGRCEVGTFCEQDGDDFECAPLLAVDDDCNADVECETGFCNGVDAEFVCAELLDDGDECIENNDCLSELCLDDGDGTLVCTAQLQFVVEACNGLQGDDTAF
jgi:hypothetical protein